MLLSTTEIVLAVVINIPLLQLYQRLFLLP